MIHYIGCINELNTKLIGKGTFARELYFLVNVIRLKLKLFSRHLNKKNSTHFEKLGKYRTISDINEIVH